jgi:hypothetical protein
VLQAAVQVEQLVQVQVQVVRQHADGEVVEHVLDQLDDVLDQLGHAAQQTVHVRDG